MIQLNRPPADPVDIRPGPPPLGPRRPDRPRRLLPLLAVTATMFVVLDLVGFGPIVTIRRTALAVGQPIGSVAEAALSPISGAWHGTVHYDDVVEENAELRRRVAELEGAIAGSGDAESELRNLLDATEIPYLGDVERVTARVMSDRHTTLERIVEIDKGGRHGVEPGMPVVTGRGLVGVVRLVVGDRSTIRLLTDVDSAVGVRSDHGLGLAAGAGGGGLVGSGSGGSGSRLVLTASEDLAAAVAAEAIGNNHRFVTSGVEGSLFPPGIPVGSLVIDDRLTLEPLADLDQLAFVTVLLVEPAS
jgi:rod shape-determining protein MreC